MTGTQMGIAPDFGTGIYSFPLAASIVGRSGTQKQATPRQLRYWLDVGLTPATFGRSSAGSLVLSFHDLVSLEVVRLFQEAGASLQRVRSLEVALRERHPDLLRPFAHNIFWTDGVSVWKQLGPDDNLVEVIGQRPNNLAWRTTIRSFATEIDYRDELAAAWRITPWVEIDPEIHFGAPIVRGTSVPVSTIEANLRAGTPDEVADWYGLNVQQVLGVREYLNAA